MEFRHIKLPLLGFSTGINELFNQALKLILKERGIMTDVKVVRVYI